MRCDGFQGRPPGGAEQLEARELKLDRHTRLRGGVDHRTAMPEDGRGGRLRGRETCG
jgi:hypothetical protein